MHNVSGRRLVVQFIGAKEDSGFLAFFDRKAGSAIDHKMAAAFVHLLFGELQGAVSRISLAISIAGADSLVSDFWFVLGSEDDLRSEVDGVSSGTRLMREIWLHRPVLAA
jgi:hypothetical protein